MSEQTPDAQGEHRPGAGGPASWPPPPPPSYPDPAYPAPQSGRSAASSPGYGVAPGPAGDEFPDHPHPQPTPYHLMLRTWSYAWWKPLAGIGLLAVLALAVQAVVAVALFVVAAARPGDMLDNITALADLSEITPTFLLLLNLSLGAMILATWVVIRVVHRMRPRWLASVAPRFRWRFFWACTGVSVIALVASLAVGLLLPGDEMTLEGGVNEFTTTTAALALIVLLTTPFQAAGEEYFFRGYLMQAIGSFLGFSSDRWVQLMAKWTALLVTSGLFALAHGVQNFPLFFDRFMFGMIAGWLIIHTGGLEAGVAMHVLNNFLAFGLALTVGDLAESLNVSEISWWNIPLTLTQAGVYAGLVVLLARFMGVQSESRPPLPSPTQTVVTASV